MANKNSPEQRARDAFKKRIQRLEQYGWVFPLEFVEKKRSIEEYNRLRGERLKQEGYYGFLAPNYETLRMPKPVAGSPARKWIDEELPKLQGELIEESVYNLPAFMAAEIEKRVQKQPIPFWKQTPSEKDSEDTVVKRYSFKKPLRAKDINERIEIIDELYVTDNYQERLREEEYEDRGTIEEDTLQERLDRQNIKLPDNPEDIIKEDTFDYDEMESLDDYEDTDSLFVHNVPPEEPTQNNVIDENLFRAGKIPTSGDLFGAKQGDYLFPPEFGEMSPRERALERFLEKHGYIGDWVLNENWFRNIPEDRQLWWAQFAKSNQPEGAENWPVNILHGDEWRDRVDVTETSTFDSTQDDYSYHDYDESADDIWDRFDPEDWDDYDSMVQELLRGDYRGALYHDQEAAKKLDEIFKKAIEKFGSGALAEAYMKAKDKGIEVDRSKVGYDKAASMAYVQAILHELPDYDGEYEEDIDEMAEESDNYEPPK